MFLVAEADHAVADRARGRERIDAGDVGVERLAAEEEIADRAADDVAAGGELRQRGKAARQLVTPHAFAQHADPLDLHLHRRRPRSADRRPQACR